MYARPNELALGREEHRGGGRASPRSTRLLPTTPNVVVLRVGDAWLVGVGKRAPHGFRCLWLVSPQCSLDTQKLLYIISLHGILKDRHIGAAG